MRCPKEITSDDIMNNLSDDDIIFNLASCEQNCDNYYHHCPLVQLMYDRLEKFRRFNI